MLEKKSKNESGTLNLYFIARLICIQAEHIWDERILHTNLLVFRLCSNTINVMNALHACGRNHDSTLALCI